jgi:peptidoglycan-associated lipoprotein
MQSISLKLLTVAALMGILSACASNQAAESVSAAPTATTPAIVSVPTPVVEEEVMGPEPGTQEHLLATVGDRVFFAYDSSELSPSSRRILMAQAEWMKENTRARVVMEGHADERGTREYNLALGERRAAAAKNYLVALGVSPRRIITRSYGKERPVVLGSNEAAWRQNRRAVMVVS